MSVDCSFSLLPISLVVSLVPQGKSVFKGHRVSDQSIALTVKPIGTF